MKTSYIPTVRRLAAVIAWCAVVVPGRAQIESSAEETVLLPAFTITAETETGYTATNSIGATRIATELKKLPVSIDVLTEQLIKDFGATEIYDIATLSASVSTSQRAAARDEQSFSIRGFTTFFTARNGSTAFRSLDSANVARTEIVNGPASVLYGQIDPGGIINVVTKQPSTRRSSNLRLDVGSWDYKRVELGTTGPIDAGKKLIYRIDASWLDRDGHRVGSSQQKNFVAPALRWQVTPRTYIQVDGEWLDMELVSNSNWPRVIDRPNNNVGFIDYLPHDFNAMGPGMETLVESYIATATLEHAFGKRIVFRNEVGITERDSDDWEANATQGVGPLANLSRGISGDVRNGQTFSNRANLAARFDFGRRNYTRFVAGWEYTNTENANRTRGTSGTLYPPPPAWSLVNPATWNRMVPDRAGGIESARTLNRTWNDEFYLLNQLSLFEEKVMLLSGLRRSLVHVITDNLRANTRTANTKRSQTSPQAGVMWRPVEPFGFYLNYSESFRQITTLRRNQDRSETPFDPLIAEGLDAGIKYDFLDGRISGALGVFNILYTNARQSFQASDDIGNYSYETQNGETTSKGVEFRLAANLTKQWQVTGGYTYVDARVTNNPANRALEGDRLPRNPYNTVQFSTVYRFTEGRLKGLELGGTVRAYSQSKAFATNDPFFIDPALIVNLRAGYSVKIFKQPTRLNLLVLNANDEYYFPSSLGPADPTAVRFSITQQF